MPSSTPVSPDHPRVRPGLALAAGLLAAGLCAPAAAAPVDRISVTSTPGEGPTHRDFFWLSSPVLDAYVDTHAGGFETDGTYMYETNDMRIEREAATLRDRDGAAIGWESPDMVIDDRHSGLARRETYHGLWAPTFDLELDYDPARACRNGGTDEAACYTLEMTYHVTRIGSFWGEINADGDWVAPPSGHDGLTSTTTQDGRDWRLVSADWWDLGGTSVTVATDIYILSDGSTAAAPPLETPLPAALGLLATGLSGLAFFGRRPARA